MLRGKSSDYLDYRFQSFSCWLSIQYYLYTVPFLPTIVFPVHILQKKLSWIQNLDVVSIEFGNVYKDLIHCWIIAERKVFSNN